MISHGGMGWWMAASSLQDHGSGLRGGVGAILDWDQICSFARSHPSGAPPMLRWMAPISVR
jgi:hypothetical protein